MALGVVVLLLTTVGTSWSAYRSWRIMRMVRADFLVIDQCVRLYQKTFQRLPLPSNSVVDLRFGQAEYYPNAMLFNVLRGVVEPGTPDAVLNPERKAFITLKPYRSRLSGVNPDGEFLDPWGSPYQVILDGNGDNICEILDAKFGSALGEMVAIWSYGPDRRPDTIDDLISW
jgi:type II secretory pathway pseudopilin PulG